MHVHRLGRAAPSAIAVTVGVMVLAASCSSAPTVAAFNNQANEICRTNDSGLKALTLVLAIPEASGRNRLQTTVSQAASSLEQRTSQLQNLAQPAGESAALKKAFALQQSQQAALTTLAAAIKQNDTAKIQAAETSFEESEAPLNQRFNSLGLNTCGSG